MQLEATLNKKLTGFDLDLTIKMENELVVLFGPSGSGKSLTLKMIAGLMAPDKGRVTLAGRDLFCNQGVNIKPQDRAIGYVFQNHSLFPHMTVFENILYGAKGLDKREAVESARQMIETYRLIGLENKYPTEISGGEQQRVALARALIRKPKALLLDEPFSALDNPIRIKMRRCLKNVMKGLGIPVILVTHDIAEACLMGDRIIIFGKGRILQAGSPKEVTENPLNPDIAGLVRLENTVL